jgi:hypothetical protein
MKPSVSHRVKIQVQYTERVLKLIPVLQGFYAETCIGKLQRPSSRKLAKLCQIQKLKVNKILYAVGV